MTGRFEVEAAGHWVQVLVDGSSGPVVVLCSGLGGRALHWRDTVAELAEDHTVVRFDRPGIPVAPGAEGRYTIRGEADRIAGVLEGVRKSEPVVVVGHSVGGFYAEAFARLYPDRTRALLLLDSSIAADPPWRPALPLRPKLLAARATATVLRRLHLQEPLTRTALMLLQRRRPGGLDAEMMCEIREAARQPEVAVALLAEHATYHELAVELCSLRPRYPLPPVPRMVVTAHTGWRTRWWRDKQIRLAKTLGAEHVTVSPAGHHVMVERPRRTADLIRLIAGASAPSTSSSGGIRSR